MTDEERKTVIRAIEKRVEDYQNSDKSEKLKKEMTGMLLRSADRFR
jgi:predicted Fe-S protein YdhL (DUF1289 family)